MGIDKSELRIGNYVEFPTHGIMKITELSMIGAMGKGEISGKCIWEKTVYKHIEPIRITKQILIDNGFTEYEDGRFSGGRLKYNFNIGLFYFDIAYPCKYVHQLQNLWKIINGKEMDFQMKLFIDEENEIFFNQSKYTIRKEDIDKMVLDFHRCPYMIPKKEFNKKVYISEDTFNRISEIQANLAEVLKYLKQSI